MYRQLVVRYFQSSEQTVSYLLLYKGSYASSVINQLLVLRTVSYLFLCKGSYVSSVINQLLVLRIAFIYLSARPQLCVVSY